MLRRLLLHYCLFFLQLLTCPFDSFSPPENLYLMLFQKKKFFIEILGLGEAVDFATFHLFRQILG